MWREREQKRERCVAEGVGTKDEGGSAAASQVPGGERWGVCGRVVLVRARKQDAVVPVTFQGGGGDSSTGRSLLFDWRVVGQRSSG